MALLAQKVGLVVVLTVACASLALSVLMLFTLRLVGASVANNCTPGGGCSVPAWVRGSPEEGRLLWGTCLGCLG
jgi:hypothetical protein